MVPGLPGKKAEKWERELEDKTVQQLVDKTCEWKCMYSRPNAKIRWYKDKKEIFSGGLKYKIVIEKAVCTLIINNPEVDDSGKYTCEANGMPTSANLVVLGEAAIRSFHELICRASHEIQLRRAPTADTGGLSDKTGSAHLQDQ